MPYLSNEKRVFVDGIIGHLEFLKENLDNAYGDLINGCVAVVNEERDTPMPTEYGCRPGIVMNEIEHSESIDKGK
jgi:hypothetical protein